MKSPRNAPEFFDLMSPSMRRRLEEVFQEFVWQTVTVTACSYDSDRRRRMDVPDMLRDAMNEAAIDVWRNSIPIEKRRK